MVHASDILRSFKSTVYWEIFDNACIFVLHVCLNHLSDGCVQCSNSARIAMIDVVFEEPAVEENLKFQIRRMSWPFLFSADMTPHKLPRNHVMVSSAKNNILVEQLFFLHFLTLLELTPSLMSLLWFNNFETPYTRVYSTIYMSYYFTILRHRWEILMIVFTKYLVTLWVLKWVRCLLHMMY